ncbi:leucine--tRNA ligase [Nocardiopsis sp. L17-MgMaSL7]|uniref:leucine--tRNA ligase n=1 Tax=Nocardiopsis sp. L17-MgMaSL7 TaxID=1938893 RepID=UPI000D7090BA|nr:leucine--tRNA ligase [Nocardiopsis sp. L17-MgMaSL7]PWV57489.1 leucyl-tRNA synthetase [Nocardiopsis sp. L17-MgMaSL7]
MTAVDGDQTTGDTYDARALQDKWQARWAAELPFEADTDPGDTRPRSYIVDMFSYPSGDLHMGHAEAYAIGDVIGRYRFQRGDNVLHPVGWDSFGLPAENAAIKNNDHPYKWTYANIETQASSMRRYGLALDWSHRLHTSDPEYYKWNQWLFTRFFERGLAYRKDGLVNWCPQDQTVLANEQVVQGKCERCGADVERRALNQWYFKITDYAQRLLDDMDQLDGGRWPDEILAMQRNWIGRSTGADVRFEIEGRDEPVTVYTTRPDTLYGATFFVVAADADLAAELCAPEQREAFEDYRSEVAKLSDIERQTTERPKTGVFLGRYAINPVNGERMPVWAADYVLAGYGHGAVMAVPAHDQRDLDFALAFDLPVRVVVETGEADPAETGVATAGEGVLRDSGPLDGLTKTDAIERIIGILRERGTGDATVNFRLRDWLLSRQRYWGTPIPIVHCPSCGEVAVPDEQLPVTLPDLQGAELAPKGISPLAAAKEWLQVDCPSCGGPAERDTDTMDTFVDSSWYFLRYVSSHLDTAPFDTEEVNKWGPVDHYIGGKEHATLHLMYARFFTKVLYDMGMVGFTEPFRRLTNQGQVINEGRAMSKSLGNGVDLGREIDAYGVDAVRLTMLFASPPEEDVDWADVSVVAAQKFLNRAYRVMSEAGAGSAPGTDPSTGDTDLRRFTHRSIDQITALVEDKRFNVAIARCMELVSAARKAIDSGPGAADPAVREAAEFVAVALSLFAPYIAEEGWEKLGRSGSVAVGNWPEADPELLVQESVTCVVQVQSKVRDKLSVSPDIDAAELERLALASEKAQSFIGDKTVRKVIVRAPKLVNIVVG